MIWVLLAGFIFWMFSPIIAEFLGYIGAYERAGEDVKPFVVSEYLDRIEKKSLDILETQEPVDQTIILWWGLDGLRVNEDGSLEWINRKKPKPVNQNVFYQPYQTTVPFPLQSQLQSYQVSYPGYYPPYLYGGMMTGYAPPMYLPQMRNCCCNRLI